MAKKKANELNVKNKSKKTNASLKAKTVHAEVVDSKDIESSDHEESEFDFNTELNRDHTTSDTLLTENFNDNLDENPDEDLLQHEDSELDSDYITNPVSKVKSKGKGRKKSDNSSNNESDSSRALTTTDPVSLYLASIRKYPLLSREEESAIAIKYYETKDPMAAQALVTANLRFVVKVAAEYSKFGSKLIDLIQEGNVGLMHAVREFNPYKGVRLITYAVWWIRGYIQEYLMRQYSVVRIGTTQNQRKLFYQLQKEKEALDALGANPTIELLAEKLHIPKDEVLEMQQRMTGRDVSLDRPLDDSSKSSMMDLQKRVEPLELDQDLALREEISLLKEKIDEIRPSLSQRELIILDERLLADEPLTLQEIGEKHGITREAVRQMEVRVIKKIRNHFLGEDY